MPKNRRFGTIVDIDLTSGQIETREFTEQIALAYLGGFGYNMNFLYENLKEGTDALGGENILIISLGLLTGTAAPSSSRVHVNALSPLSGLIGSSSLGGFMGSKLRALGFGHPPDRLGCKGPCRR
jgi:aldehyde:ferredoxin oxidoreductase